MNRRSLNNLSRRPFIAVGQNAVNAARDLLKTGKLDALQYKAVLAKGQQQGELVLEAELKLKDIIQAIPKAAGRPEKIIAPMGENYQKPTKAAVIAELGLTQKQARNITALTPEAVEQAKAAARENDDIPTRSLALCGISVIIGPAPEVLRTIPGNTRQMAHNFLGLRRGRRPCGAKPPQRKPEIMRRLFGGNPGAMPLYRPVVASVWA